MSLRHGQQSYLTPYSMKADLKLYCDDSRPFIFKTFILFSEAFLTDLQYLKLWK